MPVVQVTGPAPRDIARALRTLDKPLQREVYGALNRSVKPLRAAVKTEAARTLPHRGGYADLMSHSVKVRSQRRAATALRLIVSAKGEDEDRDVRRVDKGELRHPVYGRSRRRTWTRFKPRKRIPGGQLIPNPWATTRVRAGFATRPLEAGMPAVRRELVDALDRVARHIP